MSLKTQDIPRLIETLNAPDTRTPATECGLFPPEDKPLSMLGRVQMVRQGILFLGLAVCVFTYIILPVLVICFCCHVVRDTIKGFSKPTKRNPPTEDGFARNYTTKHADLSREDY